MQLHISDDHYVTLRGNKLSVHQDNARTAYLAAKKKFKFSIDDAATVHILDDDNGLTVTVSVGEKAYTAEHKSKGWHWQEDELPKTPAKPATTASKPAETGSEGGKSNEEPQKSDDPQTPKPGDEDPK